MKLNNIILCPSSAGQLKKGVKFFPNLIKNFVKPEFNIHKYQQHINFDNIYINSNSIYNKCIKINNNICIGGDHSISIATGASSLNKFKNTKFIWIDAHADINTYKESKSKNFHGMPLSFLTGLDYNISFSFIKNLLPFQNICYIGLRDVDPYEYHILKKNNIQYIDYQTVNNDYNKSYKILKNFINNDPVHLSFDVDSINPEFISTTGTIVENGLDLKPTKKLLNLILNNEKVICLDIVEMNMHINNHDYKKSLNNFRYLFSNIFN